MKKQLAVNFKYAESPWWYVAVKNVNQFYYSQPQPDKPPVFLSLSPPYYVDFFTDGQFIVLPFSLDNDFHFSSKVWGDYQLEDPVELYRELLKQGHQIYFTNYGSAARPDYPLAKKEIEDNFSVEKVHSGCFELCNIYQISLTEE